MRRREDRFDGMANVPAPESLTAAAAAAQVAELVTQLSMLSSGAAILYPAPLPPAAPPSAPTGAEVAKRAAREGGAEWAGLLAVSGGVGRALAVGRPSVFAAPASAWLHLAVAPPSRARDQPREPGAGASDESAQRELSRCVAGATPMPAYARGRRA